MYPDADVPAPVPGGTYVYTRHIYLPGLSFLALQPSARRGAPLRLLPLSIILTVKEVTMVKRG